MGHFRKIKYIFCSVILNPGMQKRYWAAWERLQELKNAETVWPENKKIPISIADTGIYSGAAGIWTLAAVTRPIAFRVRPLTTTWVMLQILNFRMRRAFWENFGENCRRERQKIVPSRSRKTRMKPSKTGKSLPKSQLDFESFSLRPLRYISLFTSRFGAAGRSCQSRLIALLL